MENDSNQTVVNAPYNNSSHNILTKNIYASLIIAIVIGLVVGFFISKFSLKSSTRTITQVIQVTPTPDPKILTDPYTILKSPVFDEWYGGFTGKVVAKDNTSFTVEQNGARLQIFMQKSISRISDQTVSKSDPPVVTLAQLPIGSTVQGAVTISIGTLTGNPDQHVIADGIYITSK